MDCSSRLAASGTLGRIPCLITNDAASKEQVRSGQLIVEVPEGIVLCTQRCSLPNASAAGSHSH
ncbi:MAG: hypothetical protein ACRDQ9_15770 [Pseudonocardiaceae bacterium]